MICVVCGAELEPELIIDLAGNKIRRTLWYKGKQEPASFCSNAVRGDKHAVNLWTETWIVCWVRMQKRLKKWRKEI